MAQARSPATGAGLVRRASWRSIRTSRAWTLDGEQPLGRAVPGLEAAHDVVDLEVRRRDDGVGGAVIHPDAAATELDVTAREDRVVEQAHALIVLGGFEDRRGRPRDDLGRVVGIQ